MTYLPQRKKKSLKSELLGLSLEEAEKQLLQEGDEYVVKHYVSYRPYEYPDSCRVLRVKKVDGMYELLVGEFITNVKTSQG